MSHWSKDSFSITSEGLAALRRTGWDFWLVRDNGELLANLPTVQYRRLVLQQRDDESLNDTVIRLEKERSYV